MILSFASRIWDVPEETCQVPAVSDGHIHFESTSVPARMAAYIEVDKSQVRITWLKNPAQFWRRVALVSQIRCSSEREAQSLRKEILDAKDFSAMCR